MTDTTDASGKGGDVYAKTLALLRRLLVGNGYKLEDIALTQIEATDLHIPGKLALELNISENTSKIMGMPRAGAPHTFQRREEVGQFINAFRAGLTGEQDWMQEIQAQLAKSPTQGWGLENGDWKLGKISKQCFLIIPCDICRGQKTEPCTTCFGQREIPCQTCSGNGIAICPSCGGSGNQGGRICNQCQGRARIPCMQCSSRGRIQCPACGSNGVIPCRTCQGHGVFTEQTTLSVVAKGSFELGTLAAAPAGVMEVVDSLGANGLARGHAAITSAPPHGDNALYYDAVLPFGRFKLQLSQHDPIEVRAVGMKPVLADFPHLLDDIFTPVTEELNANNLTAFGKRYRMVRELCEALGKGQKAGPFFSRHYPFALSALVAFGLANKIKSLFATLSLRPRQIAAAVSGVVAAVVYYSWLYNPRPGALPASVPTYIWDMGLLVVLAALGWFAVSMTAQKVLTRMLPIPMKIFAAGGRIALGTAGGIIVVGLILLVLPDTRPEWLGAILR